VLDKRYVLPDLRFEYRTPTGDHQGRNIELYTCHYSKRQRSIKQGVGLKGWAIFDEGNIMKEVFAAWNR
jgi:hypothetical protein